MDSGGKKTAGIPGGGGLKNPWSKDGFFHVPGKGGWPFRKYEVRSVSHSTPKNKLQTDEHSNYNNETLWIAEGARKISSKT